MEGTIARAATTRHARPGATQRTDPHFPERADPLPRSLKHEMT
ncbi:MAG: hypothetical protein JWN67_1747 [Actinomycetia bacterium]|nr:hypothetical protein [Actinomycetes bacterium]